MILKVHAYRVKETSLYISCLSVSGPKMHNRLILCGVANSSSPGLSCEVGTRLGYVPWPGGWKCPVWGGEPG